MTARRCRVAASVVVGCAVVISMSCTGKPSSDDKTLELPIFDDVTSSLSLAFVHDNGFDGKHYRVAETVNGGVGLLDVDQDGLLDIYFTNANKLDAGSHPSRDSLHRRNVDGKYEDISTRAGVGDAGFSFGCSVADLNGDGYPELFVTRWGVNRLFKNNRNGTLTDSAADAGLTEASMHTGSAFFDMDKDGDLDLYVASYVKDEGGDYPPVVVRGAPGYWPPRNYQAAQHHLYKNQGDDRFVDVSQEAGILDIMDPGRGLGVVSADFNNDGNADIYVANDMSANFMFMGDGTGRFSEAGFANGTALGDQGEELGSMGVAVADYDRDGWQDICVTNYQNQVNNLYRRTGTGNYEEMSRVSGIAQGALPEVSWGAGFADFDNDSWVDLFIANGHLNPFTNEMDQSTLYAQPKKLFRNLGGGKFENITTRAGNALRKPSVGRGAAFGDLDNDGDVDVVLGVSNGAPEILINRGRPRLAWALVRLEGSGQNRDAIGARVSVTANGQTQIAERQSASSYLSVNDCRLHFGLGKASRVDRLEVIWPSGKRTAYQDLPVGKLLGVKESSSVVSVEEILSKK